MKVVIEKAVNKIDPSITKDRSVSQDVDKLASDILAGMKLKGNTVRSLTRAGGANRKGIIVLYIPESVRANVRRMFDLSREPSEFIIQCKSGRDTEGNQVVLVTLGFATGGNVIDSIDNWLIEEPRDGKEVETILRSKKLEYTLKQLEDVFSNIRGRQN